MAGVGANANANNAANKEDNSVTGIGVGAGSQGSSSSNDELGSLVELLVREFDLVQCLLKVGHIIRVWLQVPAQALPFYQQALDASQRLSPLNHDSHSSRIIDEEEESGLPGELRQ